MGRDVRVTGPDAKVSWQGTMDNAKACFATCQQNECEAWAFCPFCLAANWEVNCWNWADQEDVSQQIDNGWISGVCDIENKPTRAPSRCEGLLRDTRMTGQETTYKMVWSANDCQSECLHNDCMAWSWCNKCQDWPANCWLWPHAEGTNSHSEDGWFSGTCNPKIPPKLL